MASTPTNEGRNTGLAPALAGNNLNVFLIALFDVEDSKVCFFLKWKNENYNLRIEFANVGKTKSVLCIFTT